jgi:hypothetical protein
MNKKWIYNFNVVVRRPIFFFFFFLGMLVEITRVVYKVEIRRVVKKIG